jgi:hypothetical protein
MSDENDIDLARELAGAVVRNLAGKLRGRPCAGCGEPLGEEFMVGVSKPGPGSPAAAWGACNPCAETRGLPAISADVEAGLTGGDAQVDGEELEP